MKSPRFGLGIILALVGLLSLILLTPVAAQAQVVKIKEETSPAAAALAQEPGEGREILHQVREGEELHMLAAYYYGDARQWPKIYQANRDLIKNPNRITKGEILSIPVAQDWQPFMPYDEFFKRASAGAPPEAPETETPAAGEEKKSEGKSPEGQESLKLFGNIYFKGIKEKEYYIGTQYFVEGTDYYEKKDFKKAKVEYKKAIVHYSKALELEKKEPTFSKRDWRILVDNLSMAYGITEDFKKAQETLEYGLSKDSTYPNFHYTLACNYADTKDLDNAIVHLKLAFKYKENLIPGEKMPDPEKDNSFIPYMKNEKFLAALKEMKQM